MSEVIKHLRPGRPTGYLHLLKLTRGPACMHSRALNKQRMVCGEEATDCLPAPASGCKNSYDDNDVEVKLDNREMFV